MLWAIALNEDVYSIERFDDEWKFLVNFVDKARFNMENKREQKTIQPDPFSVPVVHNLRDFLSTKLSSHSSDEGTAAPQLLSPEFNLLQITDYFDAPKILPERLTCKVEFINNLYAKRKHWVRRFIVEVCASKGFILGHVKSTQRDESLNRVVAEDTSPSSTLIDTFEGLYKRQKLRFLDLRAHLISEVKSVIQIPSNINPYFQELLRLPSRHIAGMLMTEISKVNLYSLKRAENAIDFIVTAQPRPDSSIDATLSDTIDVVKAFNFEYRNLRRLVESFRNSNGLIYLKCSCMKVTTAGYPCRHILFIYQLECCFQHNAAMYVPLSAYLNSYWTLGNLLPRFNIQSGEGIVNTVVESLFTGQNINSNIDLLSQHEDKMDEFKVILNVDIL